MGLNRLVRYNMQQAIYIDIALIIPGIIGGLATYILPNVLGVPITADMGESNPNFKSGSGSEI